MSDDLDRKIEDLLGEMRGVNRRLDEATTDGGRKAAALDGQKEIADKLTALDTDKLGAEISAGRKSKLEAQVEELARLMHEDRGASNAEH